MSAQTNGSLEATGSVTLTKPDTDTLTFVQISGTYGTVTFVIEGTLDGSNWFAVAAIRYDTGAIVNGTISPSDNAEQAWKVPSEGLAGVRARATAVGSGTVRFDINSGSFVGLPFTANQTTTGASVATTTFTGDVTLSGCDLVFSGTTGQNDIVLTDNLADALSVKISGGADFLVFVTTDSAEQLQCAQDFNLTGGKDIIFTGTTGQCEIILTDNLADALSVKISGGNDFMSFTSTDSAEAINIPATCTVALAGGLKETAITLTPDAANGAAATMTAGIRHYTVTTVTNDANDWVTLPPIANVPIGHQVTIACAAGGNFELRTPASSNTKINDVDSDGSQEYLCTDTDLIVVRKHTTTSWNAQSFTKLGAVRTAVIPD